MPRQTGRFDISLPKGWPKRVRSAVLQALSLVRLALTVARGHVAKKIRRRLRHEVDRLQQEIALLREEIRIKDVRMGQIPPQRRLHYQPVERMAILESRADRTPEFPPPFWFEPWPLSRLREAVRGSEDCGFRFADYYTSRKKTTSLERIWGASGPGGWMTRSAA